MPVAALACHLGGPLPTPGAPGCVRLGAEPVADAGAGRGVAETFHDGQGLVPGPARRLRVSGVPQGWVAGGVTHSTPAPVTRGRSA